jgi:phosphoglucosamine mutase
MDAMHENGGRMSERGLFGTDGVRGRANVELTPQLVFDLARAAGDGTDGPVLIGRDTRRSGPMLSAALQSGFNAVGVDTVDLGIIPVGGVSRLVRTTRARYGVMVSASHNPAADNGVKFFGSDGVKLTDEAEAVIERRYARGAPFRTAQGDHIGIHTVMADAVERYLDFLASGGSYSLRGMEFVLDCAHGAAFEAAPELLQRRGAHVEVFAAAPDGTNINDGVGATNPWFLAEHTAGRVGFAFDGDADRLIAIDEDGKVVNGDVVMAILAVHLKGRGKLKNDTIVATVMSNLGFHKAMREHGIEVLSTQVGDRYVMEAMRSSRAVLGGEQSGHVLLEDRSTGDGLRTALRVAEVMAATGRELRELRTVMTEYPQVLRNVVVADKSALAGAAPVWEAVRASEEELAGDGRILVRASGTEELVRVMVEAPTEETAARVAAHLGGIVAEVLG